MSVLTVVRGPGKGSSIALSPERGVTIGAGTDTELRVGGREVADAHLVVKALKDGGFGAKGLAGPFVHNGKTVAAARLADGDLLEVGDSTIRFAAAPADGETWPETIGGFRVLGVLGEGGMGRVYRAEQTSLGRQVALKVLSRERTSDPMFVGRFVAEARAAARLNHPNVVQVFDVDHDGETYFYSMELMNGGSVEDLIRQRGKLPVDEAAPIVLAAARALTFAEQMRVVHRDIKPDNLMIDRHGHVKVADLGLALTEEDEHGKAVGTPHFMSPEQVRHEKLDHRSDLYSLGCTFYRLVTGRTPFSGSSIREILQAQLKQEPERADEVEPTVPPAVADVIARLLEKDPDDRYGSASELITALEEAMAPPSRTGVWIASALAVVVAAVLVVVFWPREAAKDPTKVIEYLQDPNAKQALADKARLEAENALLHVRTQGLEGEALAAALDAMADAHPDTQAATDAREQAKSVRDELKRKAEEAARRRAMLDEAKERIRKAFGDALQRGDLVAANAALTPDSVDDDLRGDSEIRGVFEQLRGELSLAASAHVAALRTALTEAITAGDPDVARQRLAPLEKLVSSDGGWPDALLPDRAGLRDALDKDRAAIEDLAKARATELESTAWARATAALTAADGPVPKLRALAPGAAGESCAAIARDLSDRAAGRAVGALVPAFAAAQRYLDGYLAALEKQAIEIVLPSGERARVLSMTIEGNAAGVRVQVLDGGEERAIPLAAVRSDASRFFPALDGLPAEHAAFVGALSWAEHLVAAKSYLACLRADDDATGTGEHGYPVVTVALDDAIAQLQAAPADWTEAFTEELAATRLLARGLRALSDRRNVTASKLIERLLRDHPDALIVAVLE